MTHPANTIPWHLYNDFPHYDLFIENLITVSEANGGIKKCRKVNGKNKYTSEHWSAKNKRHQSQKQQLQFSLAGAHVIVKTPAHVCFIRYSNRLLDDDNLVSSFKHVKDYFCDYLLPGLRAGRADAKLDITFSYQQCKSKRKGTQVTIYNKKEEI